MKKPGFLIWGLIAFWLVVGISYLIYLLNHGTNLATALGYVLLVEIYVTFIGIAFIGGIFLLVFIVGIFLKSSDSTGSGSLRESNATVYMGRGSDEHYVGRVEQHSGRVYKGRGLDEHYVGRVEQHSGRVYKGRGLDERQLGQVMSNGRLCKGKDLNEQQIGKIDNDGRVYSKEMSYVGRVENNANSTVMRGGGALLLLF